jgi:hypothetical protein
MDTSTLTMKIGIVEYDFNAIVDFWVATEYREEAKEIINKLLKWDTNYSYKLLVEFIVYHEKSMGNQVCQHLDFMKAKLVDRGHMKNGGHFGPPFI